MGRQLPEANRRILVVDDNEAIHEDFRKILCRATDTVARLAEAEARLFGGPTLDESADQEYTIDSAFQGEQGAALVEAAVAKRRPYAVAFVDVRMPPGCDGIETAARIFAIDPDIQVVICTAYSDYSWKEIHAKLGSSDRLIVLKKPFDSMEVQQLAHALTEKWARGAETNRKLRALDEIIRDRGSESAASPGQGRASEDARSLEDDLRRALRAGGLSVQYQPLFDIRQQRVASIEALVRWTHPTKGPIPPGMFIPIAEQSDLILEVGDFVLRTACRQVVDWSRGGTPVVPVAVNVSGVQLERENVPDWVRTVLRETRMPPDQLMLELTESTLIANIRTHTEGLQALRRDGVAIAIDDFGTGYSALSYLRHLPLDCLKIDRSFVKQIDANPLDESIVHAIVKMAHSLNLRVVAEGVETGAQLDALARGECDVAQGFFFSRPLAAADCRALLEAAADRPTFTDTLRLIASGGAPLVSVAADDLAASA